MSWDDEWKEITFSDKNSLMPMSQMAINTTGMT